MGGDLLEYRKPPYALGSVDNALRTLHLLRDYGSVRIHEVAARLNIAPSTAHRIMAMLVYQGFAVKDDSHTYFPGAALSAPLNAPEHVHRLTSAARPILVALSEELSEVVSLSVRIGVHIRVLLTVGEHDTNDFGDRSGSVYPAHSSSAGRALLALQSPALIERLYRSESSVMTGSALSETAYNDLLVELERTRLRGFATVNEEVYRGMSSVAVPVVPVNGEVCALVVLLPPARFAAFPGDRPRLEALRSAGKALAEALSERHAPQ